MSSRPLDLGICTGRVWRLSPAARAGLCTLWVSQVCMAQLSRKQRLLPNSPHRTVGKGGVPGNPISL